MNTQTHSQRSIAALVQGIRVNDESCGNELFELMSGGLRCLLQRHLRNNDDTEEGVQECFTTVIRAIRTDILIEPAALPGYARTIVMRFIVATINKRQACRHREVSCDDTTLSIAAHSEDSLLKKEKVELMRQALSKLNQADQEILRLSYFEEKTCGQIAIELSLTREAVQSRKLRALTKLRQHFRKAENIGFAERWSRFRKSLSALAAFEG
jgi:RNA polymerase sigma-70 factor (ECF subfamily)